MKNDQRIFNCHSYSLSSTFLLTSLLLLFGTRIVDGFLSIKKFEQNRNFKSSLTRQQTIRVKWNTAFSDCSRDGQRNAPNHRSSATFLRLAENENEKTDTSTDSALKVIVIGAGWAGFSAADALSSGNKNGNNQIEVTLLDASPVVGGLASGWDKDSNQKRRRTVETGLHGFWREYKNTLSVMEKRIGLDLNEVLTPYTPSVLYSQSGRVALAPVLGDEGSEQTESSSSPDLPNIPAILSSVLRTIDPRNNKSDSASIRQIMEDSGLAELLPSPLDLALLSEFSPSSPLQWKDRISGLGLLGAWADFEQEDSDSWNRYDGISAENLVRSVAGVTPALNQELIAPLLHVLPMTPGYDCSAAAALSCFHVFALQSTGAFDVRWCRGTISDRIFAPWKQKLESCGVTFQGGSRVSSIEEASAEDSKPGANFKVTVNEKDMLECDAIVFAVGISAAKRLVQSCPPLAECSVTQNWSKLKGVTCIAVRLFFKAPALPSSIQTAMKDSPVAVCGPNIGKIVELAETGFCIYDLQRLQDEYKNLDSDEFAALEVDFFRADTMLHLNDETVVKITLRAVQAALEIQEDFSLIPDLLADASVVRARNAVSHFTVNSAKNIDMKGVKLRPDKGLYACGDWIDRTGHSSWSTEKSVVTGRQASAAIEKDFKLSSRKTIGLDTSIIPAAPDTPQLAALRRVARLARILTPEKSPFGTPVFPKAPWTL